MNMIGIDIGGTNFRIGLVDEHDQTLRFEKVSVNTVFHTTDPLSDLENKIRDFAKDDAYEAVCIGFPATINAERTRVVQAPALSFMEDLPVVDYLEDRLGVKILLERDVTYALFYDMAKYKIDPEGITCGIYYGTGIGNAIAFNGVPLKGKNGVAGEIGHIPVYGNHEKCGCGNTGCLEMLAGGKRLAKMQQEVYPETHIADLFSRHGNDGLLEEFIDLMSIAAATEINILDPDHVLLGGGLIAMKDFPMEKLCERILEHCRKPLPMETLDLLFTEDESDKCVKGAVIYGRTLLEK